MFIGMLMPVCVWHERAVRWCAPGSAGSWASRFWSSYSFRYIAVGHLSAALICAKLRMIPEKVRFAGPCVCSAGVVASSSSFMIHFSCFMAFFASSLSTILPPTSTFTPACCRLALDLCTSSRSVSCCSGLPICSCTAFRVQSHDLRKAASAMPLEVLASCILRVVLVLRQCGVPPRSGWCPPVLPLCLPRCFSKVLVLSAVCRSV